MVVAAAAVQVPFTHASEDGIDPVIVASHPLPVGGTQVVPATCPAEPALVTVPFVGVPPASVVVVDVVAVWAGVGLALGLATDVVAAVFCAVLPGLLGVADIEQPTDP